MIYFKNGVKAQGVHPEIFHAIHVAEAVYAALGVEELVVTSLKDGQHGTGSLHYAGYAVDLRIWGLQDRKRAVVLLQDALNVEYDVVLEKDHIHVEFQPKTA